MWRRWRRWLWGAGSALALACLLPATLAFFRPSDDLLWPEAVRGTVYRGAAPLGTATLTRREGRWVGDLAAFPPGTVAHFRPGAAWGFFVVRLPDGRLLALVDRTAIFGYRVDWVAALPRTASRPGGSIPGFIDDALGSWYTGDGRPYGGPAYRALDPFALAVTDGRVAIATLADCPGQRQGWEPWCR